MTIMGLMVIAGLTLVVIGLTGLLLVGLEEGERPLPSPAEPEPPSPKGEGILEDRTTNTEGGEDT